MEQGSCRVYINKTDDVPLRHITPAELLLFTQEFLQRAGGKHPVHSLEIEGEAMSLDNPDDVADNPDTHRRTDEEEYQRLANKYGIDQKTKQLKVALLFPGRKPKLPKTFGETDLLEDSQAGYTGSSAQEQVIDLRKQLAAMKKQLDAQTSQQEPTDKE